MTKTVLASIAAAALVAAAVGAAWVYYTATTPVAVGYSTADLSRMGYSFTAALPWQRGKVTEEPGATMLVWRNRPGPQRLEWVVPVADSRCAVHLVDAETGQESALCFIGGSP